MSNSIVLCEKPSQARDLAAAIGNQYGPILAAQGHLLRLQQPDEVEAGWKKWSTELLWPGQPYRHVPDAGGGKGEKLKAIGAALKSADSVIVATDPDREGDVIAATILRHFGFRGTVKRAIFAATDPASLRASFSALRPGSDFAGSIDSGICRAQADQTMNLSLTRAVTVLHSKERGRVIGIGRVKTPTLAIVVKRHLEILNFKVRIYYEITATATTAAGQTVTLRHAPAAEARLFDQGEAERRRKLALDWHGPVSVVKAAKKEAPPLLPDLPTLQVIMGRKGWTAEKTLDTAQSLYDQPLGILTYPRSALRYLPETQIDNAAPILAALSGPLSITLSEPVIRRGNKKAVYYDAGLAGENHHAIIPNINAMETLAQKWPTLSQDQKDLFTVVARFFAAAHSEDFLFDETVITAAVPDGRNKIEFRTAGRVTTRQGWRAIYQPEGDDDADADADSTDEAPAAALPPITDQTPVILSPVDTKTAETRPPPLFNDGTLIKAMVEAWRHIPESDPRRERLKDAKGIGTPATRDEVIKGLKEQKLIAYGSIIKNKAGKMEVSSKGKSLIATPEAIELIDLLSNHIPAITDPATTADWELKFDEIAQGKAKWLDVLSGFVFTTAEYLDVLRGTADPEATAAARDQARPPSPAMIKAVETIARIKSIPVPPEALTSFTACKAFLDAHPRDPAPAAERPPSEKQIDFAKKLAADHDTKIPTAVMKSAKACSEFIDKMMKKSKAAPKRK